MGIEWGAKIEVVNGAQPGWLHNDVRLRWYGPSMDDNQWDEGYENGTTAGRLYWDARVEAIRLPAGHFAYAAIAKGYEPWGGGEKAPDEWDGEHVLFRGGMEGHLDAAGYRWTHPFSPAWPSPNGGDIVGYRKRGWTKGAPFEQEATPPAPAQMTASEARMLWSRCATGDLSVNGPRGIMAVDAAVRLLDHLGLIRPDRTPLEQFLAEHPKADPATADLAITWAEQRKPDA